MLASQNGHAAVVKELLRHKANVNAVNKDGACALYFAARYLHVDIVEVLIEAGADVNARDDVGSLSFVHVLNPF